MVEYLNQHHQPNQGENYLQKCEGDFSDFFEIGEIMILILQCTKFEFITAQSPHNIKINLAITSKKSLLDLSVIKEIKCTTQKKPVM